MSINPSDLMLWFAPVRRSEKNIGRHLGPFIQLIRVKNRRAFVKKLAVGADQQRRHGI